jgi:hypothetical protein
MKSLLNLKYTVLLALMLGSTMSLMGQATFDEDVTDVPLDGGIVTITLIAAAYGAKRHKENKDKSL